MIHLINMVKKSKIKAVSKRHPTKIDKFRKRPAEVVGNETKPSMYNEHTVHNFANYVLSEKRYKALSS